MIAKISIRNYKCFRFFETDFDPDLNILVGDNEAGKSTILEAINLALTRRLNGRFLDQELSPYLFNDSSVTEYVTALREGKPAPLPTITIELYLCDAESLAKLQGTNNASSDDCPGIRLEVAFDEEYRDDYTKLLEDRESISTIPIEYYTVTWCTFANGPLSSRSQPIRASYIDATTIRLQTGTDYYLQQIVHDGLSPKERAGLAVAYRRLKQHFAGEDALKNINTRLPNPASILTSRTVSMGIDLSQRGAWEASLTPHLDAVPYAQAGKGEQHALKIMFALDDRAREAHVVLVEEPENHLSFSSMAILVRHIMDKCAGKQVFLTTHSAYVANKLGLKHLVLLRGGKALFLSSLTPDTQAYFQKLSGHDTLRLILAKRAILVEGPSDDLIVQKAYLLTHGRLPLEDGIDVISVVLSGPRFLEIAAALDVKTSVVTDNDGDYARNIAKRYASYLGHRTIAICADPTDSLPSLEDHVVEVNDMMVLNRIFGTAHGTKREMIDYMKGRKTDCALALFEAGEPLSIPGYIKNAIA